MLDKYKNEYIVIDYNNNNKSTIIMNSATKSQSNCIVTISELFETL